LNDYLDEARHAADTEGALFRPVSNNRTRELDHDADIPRSGSGAGTPTSPPHASTIGAKWNPKTRQRSRSAT